MTATPIPRSLALTFYGDLEASQLDEMPPGRAPIATRVVGEKKRDGMYGFLRERMAAGEQGYVVYPLVEESEALDLKDATTGYEALKAALPGARVALVHGRMAGAEKERVMRAFAAGELDLLVATTVIEVGVDVANATFMVVEHAERFGLAQLHQLRGRVGRGERPAWCFLMVSPDAGAQARERVGVIARTHDGFAIAEEDLRLRGQGDVFGTRQHGVPDFRIADVERDVELLAAARSAAFAVADLDPDLARPEHRGLRAAAERRAARDADLARQG
jgi:ATP-dependent DNA helicase RecG